MSVTFLRGEMHLSISTFLVGGGSLLVDRSLPAAANFDDAVRGVNTVRGGNLRFTLGTGLMETGSFR